MDSITLENYRCFREKQSARLAPLTLLVGNNSTGKTSFLALIRTLWDVAYPPQRIPDFREEPYDLGTFRNIAHNRSGQGAQASAFEAGFEDTTGNCFGVVFEEHHAHPFPVARVLAREDMRFEAHRQEDGNHLVRFTTPDIKMEEVVEDKPLLWEGGLVFLGALTSPIIFRLQEDDPDKAHTAETAAVNENLPYKDALDKLMKADSDMSMIVGPGVDRRRRPFASAPIRSRPRRTYDPTRPARDPEGEYIPTYLAGISYSDKKEWTRLKSALAAFGRESGLFDEIEIKLLGRIGGSPFQVQIRKFGRRLKGAKRNLIDVGYGVSQTLPLLTELLRKDAPSMFLLQQPEVHLHPSAQAALGSLFCKIAGPNRQLIVETHSNYILDRVRMDIRDKKSDLKPEDISILFFEPGELDVTIHSLRIDQDGNVLDSPPGYGQFFIDETRRSIGI